MRERERERERTHASGGGTEKGSQRLGIQRIQSRFCADSREPHVGLKLTNFEIMT